jgi:release factor glutamine methyltransferase
VIAVGAAGSVGDALGAAVDALAAAGVESPRLDAELLLAEATGLDRTRLLADPDAPVEAGAGRRFGEMVRRRLRREPLAYIVGRKWFRRLELGVDGRVLVPRPETELLVEVGVELGPRRALDVGTGSGAVALALADELPGVRVTASDSSTGALEVARRNADRCGLGDGVEFVESGALPEGDFDLLLANLPYVAEPDWEALAPEIRDWEPREALLAGPDGLSAIRALAAELAERGPDRAPPAVALEVGAGQAAEVGAMLAAAGYGRTEARTDLAGVERVVLGRR